MREPGFYWVKRSKESEWEIAYYDDVKPVGGWRVVEWQYTEGVYSFEEIDERRIVRDGYIVKTYKWNEDIGTPVNPLKYTIDEIGIILQDILKNGGKDGEFTVTFDTDNESSDFVLDIVCEFKRRLDKYIYVSDEVLMSLGQMTRFANRIKNNHPDLVSEFVSKQIDEAMSLISKNSTIKDSEILKYQ